MRDRGLNQLLMSAMEAIKDAYRHRRRAEIGGDVLDSVPNIHGLYVRARAGVT
ncbi:hypothetical protein CFL01nite_03830 [Corynebacterium flavescens]|uniref:Transposase n=1 Tax=Corynebacterium flavescens TaxID=28028 RepID=A0AB73B595_CORFL|nr:hypothetical protein CFL01nite_03830 [Corynebacterium flavescens]